MKFYKYTAKDGNQHYLNLQHISEVVLDDEQQHATVHMSDGKIRDIYKSRDVRHLVLILEGR